MMFTKRQRKHKTETGEYEYEDYLFAWEPASRGKQCEDRPAIHGNRGGVGR